MKILILNLLFWIFESFNCQFDLQDYGVIFNQNHRSKYHWGTYKPNLYFAMKNRRNMSETFGILWFGANKDDFEKHGSISNRIRHNCRMEDNVNYRWEAHNGVDYGRQIIEDKDYNLKLMTSFVKTQYNYTLKNQSWSSVISGDILQGKSNDNYISLFLYVSKENYEISDKSYFKYQENDSLYIKGFENDQENFFMKINVVKGDIIKSSIQKYRKRYNETWRVKRFVTDDLSNLETNTTKEWEYATFKTNEKINQPNIIVLQLVIKVPFEIVINYSSQEKDNLSNSLENLNNILKEKEDNFNLKFNSIYQINYNDVKIDNNNLKEMGKQALSNVLGGIGYFWGSIKINLPTSEKGETQISGFKYAVEAKGLFTGTPSRSFFARGFLWDEGFHNILISQWDIDLSMDIIDSWLSTMSATGWMAREQIRGTEAESQVPLKFQTQDKSVGNPPTMIFAIENIMQYYKYFEGDNTKYNRFLKKCYDKLGSWYEWYLNTQKSVDGKNFQWFGRNSEHNLACGLDDYPRGMTPNIEERHLDLHIWILEMTKTLRKLSEIFNYEMVGHFDNTIKRMNNELNLKFLDEEKGLFNDFIGPQFKLIKSSKYKRLVPPYLWRGDNRCGKEALNPLGTSADCNPYSDLPCCSEFGWCGNTDGHCKCPKCKKAIKLEDNSEFTKEEIFNPHLGYVNLYPLAFGLIKPDSAEFKNTIDLLISEDELLSPYGIRSLSKSDLLYHTGDDYWRGNIWMNINYLVVRGLYKFYRSNISAMKAYNLIRSNLIKTIYEEWKISKTLFEQYSDTNGKGIKARPFNGWTSLILNIIAENYNN